MKENRDTVIDRIVESEGRELNLSKDEPGGASRFGVSVAAYTDYRKRLGLPPATVQTIRELIEAEARQFYAEEFLPWIRFDELPTGVDYRLADVETNLGRSGGTKLAQRVVGTLETGRMDDETVRRLQVMPAADLITAIGNAWLAVKSLSPSWALDHKPHSYRKGWQNRAAAVNKMALAMLAPMMKETAVKPMTILEIQAALNKLGAQPRLDEDGWSGTKTRAAVTAFQTKEGLKADGVAGPITQARLRERLAGAPLPKPPAPPAPKPIPAEGRGVTIVFQRGLGGGPTTMGYSLGLDALAAKAAKLSPRVRFNVFEHTEDEQALSELLAAAQRGDHLVDGGHSLGASSAARSGNAVAARGIVVALLFLFDPTWNEPAPAIEGNVSRAIDFYRTSPFSPLGHDRIEPAAGFKGYIANIPVAALHQNVDDDLGAHSLFLREIEALLKVA